MPELKTAAGLLLAVLLAAGSGISVASEPNDPHGDYRPDTAFKEIVADWQDGRFEDLYDQGSRTSRAFVSRQAFVRLMQNSNIRLQCCWATVQNMRWIAGSMSDGTVTAMLGYQNFSKMEKRQDKTGSKRLTATSIYKDDTFRLSREEGFWRIDLSDILSAEGYVFAYPTNQAGSVHTTEQPKEN
jgi:hypothetical protein